MSIYQWFKRPGPSGFGYGTTAEQVTAGLSLAGKTILITGCNAGLGHEAMRVLAMRGARVVGTARTLDKAQAACASVAGETVPLACELAEPASVHACVAEVKRAGLRLDAVIANAGIMALPERTVRYGYELQFLTNHIGHFILVTGVLDQLADTGRVVMLSSAAHGRAPEAGIEFDNLDAAKHYTAFGNYGQSKLANLLFAKELARRFAGSRRTANAVHPGVIRTKLTRHMTSIASAVLAIAGPIALKSVAQGAATEVYVATNPGLADVSGEYFADCNVARSRRDASDPALAKRLWEVSERIVAELPRS